MTMDQMLEIVGPRPPRWRWLKLRRWHRALDRLLTAEFFRDDAAQDRLLEAIFAVDSFSFALDGNGSEPYGESMSKTLPNPIPHRWIENTDDVKLLALYDAFEGGDPAVQRQALDSLIGMPCTYSNGRDAYAGKVTLATPSKIVADMGNLGEMTFRPRDNKRASGWMSPGRACGWLHVGKAEPRICMEA